MNEYELMTILHPRLSADETAAAIASIEAQIAAHGGEMLSTDVWGRRRMAYPINGNMDGTYVLMTLKMPPTGASPLEAWLLITDPVLRHLLIRGIIPYQGRDRDDDRDRDRDRDERDDRDDRDERDERDNAAPVAVLDSADAPEEVAEAAAAEE
ncbi:MAG: 30S ribosomal protein S6 [Dehalococcoidia bacterium]